jgi:hypothetical protein
MRALLGRTSASRWTGHARGTCSTTCLASRAITGGWAAPLRVPVPRQPLTLSLWAAAAPGPPLGGLLAGYALTGAKADEHEPCWADSDLPRPSGRADPNHGPALLRPACHPAAR